jgi:hypothetical protein
MSEAGAAVALSVPEKLLRSRANVSDDLAEQEGGEVASAMHWNSRATTVWVPELLVGPSLANFFETHPLKDRDHLSRTQDG